MKKYCKLLILLLISNVLYAQDRVNSLFFSHPMMVGPSFTGLVEGLARGRVSHNMERYVFNSNGTYINLPKFVNVNTTSFSAEMPINTQVYDGGGGISVFTEAAGGLRKTDIQMAIAYEAPLGTKLRFDHLRVGFQVDIKQWALLTDDLYFEDQFLKDRFSLPSTELASGANTTTWSGDVSMGLLWYRTQRIIGNPEFTPWAGFSIHHINRPEVGFYTKEQINMGYRFYGGFKQRTRTPFDINLAFMYFWNNRSNLANLSIFGRYALFEGDMLSGDETFAFTAGLNLRISEALSPFIGIEYKKYLSLAISCDFYTNRKDLFQTSTGGFQVMASYVFGVQRYNGGVLPLPIF